MTLSPASSLYIIQPLATELQFCHSCGFIFKLLQSEGLEKVKSELSEFHLRHLLAANLQKLFQILLGNRQCSRSIHTLRKSVINGCVACSALLDSLPMEQQDLVSKSRRGWDLPVTVSLKTESGHKEEITNIKLRFSVRKEGIHRAVGRYISAQISVHTDHGKCTAKPNCLICILIYLLIIFRC